MQERQPKLITTMKKLFLIVAAMFAAVSFSACSDDDDNGDSSALPSLPNPNDVCSCMTNAGFIKCCYENFDLNGDGAVSKTEAAAVTDMSIDLEDIGNNTSPLTGIGYFSNVEQIDVRADGGTNLDLKIDLRYNKKLQGIDSSLWSYDEGKISIYLPETYIGKNGGRGPYNNLRDCNQIFGKHASADNRCWIINGKLMVVALADLTEYTIPNDVTSIEWGAFGKSNYSYLTSVTIPNNVISISEPYRFYYTEALEKIYCKPNTPPNLDWRDIPSSIKIYVPTKSVNAYKTAEDWEEYADQIFGYDF